MTTDGKVNCRVCGTLLGNLTATHLRGPKCKDYKKEGRLTVARYFELFPEELFPEGLFPEGQPLKHRKSSVGDKPKKMRKSRLGKGLLAKLAKSFDDEAIRAELERIDAEIIELNVAKLELQALRQKVVALQKALNADADADDEESSDSDHHTDAVKVRDTKALQETIKNYLESAGAATLSALARGLSAPSNELQPTLNVMVAAGRIKVKGNKYCSRDYRGP